MKQVKAVGRGFTLVELMASMAVGMAVLLVAATMLGNTGDGYERLSGGVGAEREARALFGQISADLSSALYHKDTLFRDGTEEWPLDQIGFLSLQPDDAQADEGRVGDLCAVRYYVKDEVNGGKVTRCLMRGFAESKDTFKALENKSMATLFQKPAVEGAANTDEAIAFGVLSFEARPKVRDNNGNLTDWVAGDTTQPDLLAIKLVIARRELVGKFRTASDWSGSGNASNLLGTPADAGRNRNIQIYETTVKFGNHEPK